MGRGRHSKTQHRMAIIYNIAEERQPITVRGVAYQLFTRGVIPLMTTNHTQMVSRTVTQMREEGTLPWHWIVDDGRQEANTAAWR